MFGYFLELALRSLKRSPGLAALMVLAIGFGVAASMTTYSVFRAVSGDPIPWKSSKLFVPQVDMWGTASQGTGEPPDGMDYTDAQALMHAHRARLQSAMYQISPLITPADAGKHPFNVFGHAVSSEFFPMVDAPFEYGGGWSGTEDAQRAAVVVISSRLNQRMFGGGNSVGRTLHLEGKDYRVAGVLKDWNPQPRYYDIFSSGGFSSRLEDVFVPFERAIAVELSTAGQLGCKMAPTEAGFAAMQRSSCQWISYMVELDDAAAAGAYRRYLDNYAREQQQAGRFDWAPNNRLRNLPDWLDYQQVVPRDTKVSVLVALGLLIACLVNTASLLLAKFLRRSGEIGVRRALGAPRRAIYGQFLTEAGMIGLAGGVLGLVLTGAGVFSVSWVLPREIAALTRLDFPLLGLTLLVAVGATVLAGLYPTFRAARVQPAWQLKSS